jgi:glycosyltransferase involved in cell wall biosynthesis
MFTVATPTFNRAHTLPRVYESLERQTFRSFEWIVIDDGSSDGTKELVDAWISASTFPIRYAYQPNSGKAVGENRAAELARGRFLAILDSDDWYAPTALAVFASAWGAIPEADQPSFAGVVALCVDPDGVVVGDRFPADVLDTDYTELRSTYGVRGDKSGCTRLDVVRKFPYPVFEGERRATFESTVLRRMAREYRCRCVNEVVLTKEYQPDGVTASGWSQRVASPRSAKLSMLESLRDRDLAMPARLENYAHHFRFAAHAGLLRESWADSPSKALWLATAPMGGALYVRDRWRALRRPPASPA